MEKAMRRSGCALALMGLMSVGLIPSKSYTRGGGVEGSLVLLSQTVGAEVFIDGKLVGKVPIQGPIRLKPGKYTLKITKRGYTEYIDVFTIRPRKETRLEIDLLPVVGILSITANIGRARVFVDGKYMGETPLEVEVPPGVRTLRLTKGGYRDLEKRLEVVAGNTANLDLTLEELPPEANPFKPPPPKPLRWYERWWVWAVIAGGASVLAVAIAVPSYYLSRDPVEVFGPHYCWGIGVSCK